MKMKTQNYKVWECGAAAKRCLKSKVIKLKKLFEIWKKTLRKLLTITILVKMKLFLTISIPNAEFEFELELKWLKFEGGPNKKN